MEFGKGVTEKVISSRMLKEQIEFDSNKELEHYLKGLGYKRWGNVNYKGTQHCLWIKDVYGKTVRKVFRKSMEETK